MNSQRNVIYAKRKNALFGERLDVDLNNSIYDTVEELVSDFKEGGSYEEFELEFIRVFSVDPSMDTAEFTETGINTLTEKLFEKVKEAYLRKTEHIASQTFPVLKDVFDTRGDQIENIVVPFTDGVRALQVTTNLKKAISNDGREVFKSFDKGVVLALIDEAWKEHLREMDVIKQSVQNAVYEQKDPIIIYKMEAFNLFKDMLVNMNKEIVSFLFKGEIPLPQPQEIREARPVPTQNQKLKVSKAEFAGVGSGTGADPLNHDTREIQKTQPIRNENKVGRNDQCPCGSGKKYKNCHGIGQS
jgi:preprotein translocase subunit SecA